MAWGRSQATVHAAQQAHWHSAGPRGSSVPSVAASAAKSDARADACSTNRRGTGEATGRARNSEDHRATMSRQPVELGERRTVQSAVHGRNHAAGVDGRHGGQVPHAGAFQQQQATARIGAQQLHGPPACPGTKRQMFVSGFDVRPAQLQRGREAGVCDHADDERTLPTADEAVWGQLPLGGDVPKEGRQPIAPVIPVIRTVLEPQQAGADQIRGLRAPLCGLGRGGARSGGSHPTQHGGSGVRLATGR